LSTEDKNRPCKVEVCFTPAIFDTYQNTDAIVIVVDVLRATSAICAAFMNGVKEIIPVGTIEEARDFKKRNYLVAAERDGIVLDFADFGNSPFNFTADRIKDKTIVYSTTNGTQAVQMASKHYRVAVGAYLNLSALCNWSASLNRDVIVFCAGWKNKFSLEDTILAGAIVEILIDNHSYEANCDSALASLDLWKIAKNNLIDYIDKAAQRSRLRLNGLDDVIEYCHSTDLTDLVPVYNEGKIICIHK
jgi:2-phosphosulfolactate phosphatase